MVEAILIELAKRDMLRNNVRLPDKDLAYLQEGSEHFDDYTLKQVVCVKG